ncbi:MAG: peptidoglycan DD-metalloendopeptidase family protein [Candidatus Eremiobacteraeota bacterium]|nr:peptidoglycan DD-metalloendopeptidase family protein [Candidatus Eremiobacteraeota bacterium]
MTRLGAGFVAGAWAALGLAVFVLAPPLAGPGPAVAAAATPVPLSEKIRQKRATIEGTRRKLEASRRQLHAARFKEQTISQQLNAVQNSIARVRLSLSELRGSISQNELRLAIRRGQLTATQQSLSRHRDALNRRLVDVYEYGSTSYLDVLLSATSFVDFIERWDFVRYILRADGQLIDTVNREQARFQQLVYDLESTQAALLREKEDQLRRNDQLGVLAGERRQLLAIAATQRSVIAQQVTELENLSAAEEARLQELIREKQREEALAVLRARMAAAQARRAAAIAAGLPPPVERPEGGPVAFQWPVRGPITSPFGMRTDPVTGRYQLHSGVDIGAGYGVPIQASADGIVIYAGWYGGYGNAIILDHSSGLSTLYAHCSAMYVAERQWIQRGQVIGAVGATGWATGPHLHFEIRVNGVPVDPLSRL